IGSLLATQKVPVCRADIFRWKKVLQEDLFVAVHEMFLGIPSVLAQIEAAPRSILKGRFPICHSNCENWSTIRRIVRSKKFEDKRKEIPVKSRSLMAERALCGNHEKFHCSESAEESEINNVPHPEMIPVVFASRLPADH